MMRIPNNFFEIHILQKTTTFPKPVVNVSEVAQVQCYDGDISSVSLNHSGDTIACSTVKTCIVVWTTSDKKLWTMIGRFSQSTSLVISNVISDNAVMSHDIKELIKQKNEEKKKKV